MLDPMYKRPLIIALVVIAELGLIVLFYASVKEFAISVQDVEPFRGLGTLFIGAPVAFLLWAWRNYDKQRELGHDSVRLQNESDKAVLENQILEGEAVVAKEKVEKAELEINIETLKGKLALAENQRDSQSEAVISLTEKLSTETEKKEALLAEANKLRIKIAELETKFSSNRISNRQVLTDTDKQTSPLLKGQKSYHIEPKMMRRNERCHCKSGRKYKHCHGRLEG